MTEFVDTALGDRIAYDLRGNGGGGPAIVFVAGAGPYRAVDPTTTATAELVSAQGIPTLVYDRVARGESVAQGPIHLDCELAALTSLVEIGGGSAVLCGHSSGCSISLYAAAHGAPVAGLVLWEAPLGPEKSGIADWATEIGARLDAGDREGALVYYMRDMPPEWLEGARHSPMWPSLVGQVDAHRPDAESLAWAESGSRTELFAGIHVPVESLIGEQTMPIMQSAAEAIVTSIPGATRAVLPGANHSWEPDSMAAELVRFVRTL